MSNWTVADTVEAAEGYVFTNNPDGTITLTIDLARDTEFKVLAVGMKYNIEYAESAIPRELIGANGSATVATAYKLTWTDSKNIGVGLSGKYTFTLNPDGGTNNILSYTFEATDATETTVPQVVGLNCYIKGPAVGGWDEKVEANKMTEGENGVYKITFQAEADAEFMFNSYEVYDNGNLGSKQKDYFNNGNTTLTNVGNCVTAPGNYKTVAAGWYTATLDPEAKTLTITYSATNPAA